MLITKLEIESFGKINNLVIDLEKGINVIYGENEAGKSTISAFIKFMLFSFAKEKISKNNPLPQREKYQSFENEIIKGKMHCNYKGIDIIIEKEYKKSYKSPKTLVYNAVTHEELSQFTLKEPGDVIYGISEETFNNTVFLSQNELKSVSTDEIEIKLRNLASTGDDDTSYFTAVKEIDAQLRKIETNRGGKLPEVTQKLLKLNNEYIDSQMLQESAIEGEKKSSKIIEEISMLKNKLEQTVNEKSANQAFLASSKLKEIDDLNKEKEQLTIELENQNTILNNQNINSNTISFLKDILSEYTVKSEIKSNLILEKAEINTKQKNPSEPKKSKKMLYSIILIIALTVLCVFLFSINIFLALSGLSIVFVFIVRLFLSFNSEKKNIKKSADILKQQLDDKDLEINKIDIEISNIVNKTKAFTDNFSVENINDVIKEFENAIEETAQINLKIATISAKISGLMSGVSIEELKKLSNIKGELSEKSEAVLDDEIKTFSAKISYLEVEYERLNGESKYIFKNVRTPDDILSDINLLKQEQVVLQNTKSALQLAKSSIEDAYSKLQLLFAPTLSEKAQNYFEKFTSNQIRKLYILKDSSINIALDGKNLMLNYFSTGTIDAIYIAVRMAICDLIFSNEKPPILFDDSFSHFDIYRLKNAVNLVLSLSSKYQIIYFTCKNEELAIFEKSSNVIKI